MTGWTASPSKKESIRHFKRGTEELTIAPVPGGIRVAWRDRPNKRWRVSTLAHEGLVGAWVKRARSRRKA